MAMGPSSSTEAFNPMMRQLFPEHERLLPASVVDEPATTVTPVISGEKPKDHWSPAVGAPSADVRVMGREMVPPAVADPDPIDNVMLCANASDDETSSVSVIKSLRTKFCQSSGEIGVRVGLIHFALQRCITYELLLTKWFRAAMRMPF